jgi:hypothetical protein
MLLGRSALVFARRELILRFVVHVLIRHVVGILGVFQTPSSLKLHKFLSRFPELADGSGHFDMTREQPTCFDDRRRYIAPLPFLAGQDILLFAGPFASDIITRRVEGWIHKREVLVRLIVLLLASLSAGPNRRRRRRRRWSGDMDRLMKDGATSADGGRSDTGEKTVDRTQPTGVVRQRRQYGIVLQLQGDDGGRWVICGILGCDLLSENVIV